MKNKRIATYPLGEGTELHLTKTPFHVIAQVWDTDAEEYYGIGGRMWKFDRFGEAEAERLGLEWAKAEARVERTEVRCHSCRLIGILEQRPGHSCVSCGGSLAEVAA